MSRAKKRKQAAEEEARLRDAVQDTAARFTCATEIAGDFAHQCTARLESLDLDLVFATLAVEIWNGQDERTKGVLAALTDFEIELRRQVDALNTLKKRLASYADNDDLHIHLDPPESYRDLIRRRMTEPPPVARQIPTD